MKRRIILQRRAAADIFLSLILDLKQKRKFELAKQMVGDLRELKPEIAEEALIILLRL